jgi:hypothetical protein
MKHIILIITLLLSTEVAFAQTNAYIASFAFVQTNEPKNIVLTLTPTPIDEDALVEIHCISGTGNAVFFPSMNTTTNIRQSCVLVICGTQLSTIESNMVMNVKIGENILASKGFSVIDTNLISFSQARAIAEQSIMGAIEPEAGSPVTVILGNENTEYTVTFENRYDENTLRGEFSARICVGADEGNIISGESGP